MNRIWPLVYVLALLAGLALARLVGATEFRVQFDGVVGGASYYVAVNETPAVAITPTAFATWAPTPNPSKLAIYVAVPGTPGGPPLNFRVCANAPNQSTACSENVSAAIPSLTATATATATASMTASRSVTPPPFQPTNTHTKTPLNTPDIHDVNPVN